MSRGVPARRGGCAPAPPQRGMTTGGARRRGQGAGRRQLGGTQDDFEGVASGLQDELSTTAGQGNAVNREGEGEKREARALAPSLLSRSRRTLAWPKRARATA